MNKINTIERIKLIKAMEFIMRNVNDEDIMSEWLMDGVPDGDIEYGNLAVSTDDMTDEYGVRYWADNNDEFSDIIDTFLHCMARARKSGGLYCDGVCAGERQK